MGGPGASVLVRNKLTKQQEEELEAWLRSITHDLERNKWGYEFYPAFGKTNEESAALCLSDPRRSSSGGYYHRLADEAMRALFLGGQPGIDFLWRCPSPHLRFK